MAHSVHQFTEARALIGGEGVPGMSQIVEVDAWQADLGDRGHPSATVEIAVPKRRSHRAGEYERLSVGQVEALKMRGQLSLDQVGEWHGAPSGWSAGTLARRAGVVSVDFPGGGAGDDGGGFAVDDEGELVVLSGHCNGFAAWIMPTWIFWLATMMRRLPVTGTPAATSSTARYLCSTTLNFRSMSESVKFAS